MSCKIISLINMKGGVAKTTLSIGISDYLSSIGKKILIIDADPQFNATQALLDEYSKNKDYTNKNQDDSSKNFYTNEILDKEKTIYKLFRFQPNLEKTNEEPNKDDLIVNLKENLDIICGDLNLVLVNKINDHYLVKKLHNFIKNNSLREFYDYIIIDCPPTLTLYTDSALMASDYYLIPNRIDRYSIIGIDSLQKAVQNLITQEDINLKCLGLIYTIVDRKNPKKQKMLKMDFENKETVSNINIFTSMLTEVSDIQRGRSGALPTKYQNSREDIESISLELIDKIKKDEE